jgi:hypothetical protein
MSADLEICQETMNRLEGSDSMEEWFRFGPKPDKKSLIDRISERLARSLGWADLEADTDSGPYEFTGSSVGAVGDSASAAGPEDEGLDPDPEKILHANLWVEDEQKQPVPSPLRIRASEPYSLLFAIEPRLREMVSSSQIFIESAELQNAPATEVEVEAISDLLTNGEGCQTKKANYYSGQGLHPLSFDLKSARSGCFHITVRLYCKNVILYRDELVVEVEGESSNPSSYREHPLTAGFP